MTCTNCHFVLDEKRGESFCDDCGTVAPERVFDRTIPFNTDDNGVRQHGHNGPPMMPGSPLDTVFWVGKDAKGKSIPARVRPRLYRMAKVARRIRSHTERSPVAIYNNIRAFASRAGLPEDVVDRAVNIGNVAHKKGLLHGVPFVVSAAACLMLAAKMLHVPRSAGDMDKLLPNGTSRSRMLTAYRKVKRGLKLGIPLTQPLLLLPRFASELGLTLEETAQVRETLNQMNGNGGSPYVTLAAAVYYVTHGRRGLTQTIVAETCHCSEVSLRNRLTECFPGWKWNGA